MTWWLLSLMRSHLGWITEATAERRTVGDTACMSTSARPTSTNVGQMSTICATRGRGTTMILKRESSNSASNVVYRGLWPCATRSSTAGTSTDSGRPRSGLGHVWVFCGAELGCGAEIEDPSPIRRIRPRRMTSAPQPKPRLREPLIVQFRVLSAHAGAKFRLVGRRSGHSRHLLHTFCAEIPPDTPKPLRRVARRPKCGQTRAGRHGVRFRRSSSKFGQCRPTLS